MGRRVEARSHLQPLEIETEFLERNNKETTTPQHDIEMGDYKTFLAENILTEDKLVIMQPFLILDVANKLAGNLSAPQSSSQGACQQCKGVRTTPPSRRENADRGFRMLYDFHRQQNAKKPGTLHATYLISGTKREEEAVPTNGDVKMEDSNDYIQSSPFVASSMPQVVESTGATSVLSITLAREEDLDGMYPSF